jgi:Holliday junction resolvase RusA-like endonuclease
MKKQIQKDISYYIRKLPAFDNPIRLKFLWIESNKKRDLDNICYAKKFILDAMVECGKMKDDNRNYVVGFTDSFEYGKETKVILEIEEDKQ